MKEVANENEVLEYCTYTLDKKAAKSLIKKIKSKPHKYGGKILAAKTIRIVQEFLDFSKGKPHNTKYITSMKKPCSF